MANQSGTRLGIVGCGGVSHAHGKAARNISHKVQFVACCDISEERARSWAAQYGCEGVYTDYEEMICKEDLDGVLLATWPSQHREQIEKCLAAGTRNILCEKALALTGKEAMDIWQLVRAADAFLREGFMYRHHPAICKLERVLSSGELGRVDNIRAVFSSYDPEDTPATDSSRNWRQRKKCGGGVPYDFTCYTVNACSHFVADVPRYVFATGSISEKYQTVNRLYGMIKYANGCVGIVESSSKSSFSQELQITCADGILNLPLAWAIEEEVTIEQCRSKGWAHILTDTYTIQKADAFQLQLENFVDVIQGNAQPVLPLRAYARKLNNVPPLRADVAWALPLPFHILWTNYYVLIYGVDRSVSTGTVDFLPPEGDFATLRVYYPDTTKQGQKFYTEPNNPGTIELTADTIVVLEEVLAAKSLLKNEDALIEAEKLAADILLKQPRPSTDLTLVANRIVAFYLRCGLWEENALGPGQGWFRNMWTYTATSKPIKAGAFDLGWGEGYGIHFLVGLVRHWARTGNTDLLQYVNKMSRSIDCFRHQGSRAYYDRWKRGTLGDFVGKKRIWTHSLAYVGYLSLALYEDTPNYPHSSIRDLWRKTGLNIAAFLAHYQQRSGDLLDAFTDNNADGNPTPHRIPARLSACGLWTHVAKLTKDESYLKRALRLALAAAKEIEAYQFCNSMIDATTNGMETTDGENAFYALEGLVELYSATGDHDVLRLCKQAAGFAISWMYFYDLPKAYRGVARGGLTCRMPDYPLLFPGGGAKGVASLVYLSEITGDLFYTRIAHELIDFVAAYQIEAPNKPWNGGIVHAFDQHGGRYWGEGFEGQVDVGETTGGSLLALEFWLRHWKKEKE